MMRKKRDMMKYFSVAFSAAFIFISVFANCLHARHQEGFTTVTTFSANGQSSEITAASGECRDCDGDCPACSYLLAAQGTYFDNVNLPEKQVPDQYSVAEQNFSHNKICIEYLPRAPPYFTA